MITVTILELNLKLASGSEGILLALSSILCFRGLLVKVHFGREDEIRSLAISEPSEVLVRLFHLFTNPSKQKFDGLVLCDVNDNELGLVLYPYGFDLQKF